MASDKEIERFIKEKYTINLDMFCEFAVENGKVSVYNTERGNNRLVRTYDAWQEFVRENGSRKIDALKELDILLNKKNEGYKEPFPFYYEFRDGVYIMRCEDESYDCGCLTKTFCTCDELAEYIMTVLIELPIARSLSLEEMLEAKRELDYYKVNYKSRQYYDERLGRSVYMLCTWREETRKIKDYNWFHDMYCHPVR